MIRLALLGAGGLLILADLWLVWMSRGVPLSAVFDPAMQGEILFYIWPAVLAGAVLALGLALPLQMRLASRTVQTSLNHAERARGYRAGHAAAQRALAQREQAAQAQEQQQATQDRALAQREHDVEQRVRQGVAAAQQAQRTAESARDQALARGRESEHQAADAERRRQNAAGTAERRRRKLERQNPSPAAQA